MAHGFLHGSMHTILDNNLTPEQAVLYYVKQSFLPSEQVDLLSLEQELPENAFEPSIRLKEEIAEREQELATWNGLSEERKIECMQNEVEAEKIRLRKQIEQISKQNDALQKLSRFAGKLETELRPYGSNNIGSLVLKFCNECADSYQSDSWEVSMLEHLENPDLRRKVLKRQIEMEEALTEARRAYAKDAEIQAERKTIYLIFLATLAKVKAREVTAQIKSLTPDTEVTT